MSATKVEVEGAPTYNGVRVDHPSIVASIKNLIKQGRNTEYICRVVGMPAEVVSRIRSEVKADK